MSTAYAMPTVQSIVDTKHKMETTEMRGENMAGPPPDLAGLLSLLCLCYYIADCCLLFFTLTLTTMF